MTHPADQLGGLITRGGGSLTRAINRTEIGCGNIGPNPVTLTVVDLCGNTNNCTAIVTVRDVRPPLITCPANVLVNANLGQCSVTGVALGAATATDNCALLSVVSNALSNFPVGTNFVAWTAADVSGNSASCTQLVVVVDNQPPVVSCPADVIVTIPDELSCACDVPLGNPVVNDNCGVASVANNAPSCFSAGTNLVVWTATDIHGNSAICTQRVIVIRVVVDSSNFGIHGIEIINNDIKLTWQTFGNTTNVIQTTTPIVNGNYTNIYIDLATLFIPGSGAVITDWVDYGGATNSPSRFYRIRLQPGAPACSP